MKELQHCLYNLIIQSTFSSTAQIHKRAVQRVTPNSFLGLSLNDRTILFKTAFALGRSPIMRGMKASILIAIDMTLLAAMSCASENNAIDEHVIADFVVNLSGLSGEGNTEVNYVSDRTTFEEREIQVPKKV